MQRHQRVASLCGGVCHRTDTDDAKSDEGGGRPLQAALTEAFSRSAGTQPDLPSAGTSSVIPQLWEFLRSIVTGIAQLGLTVIEHVKVLGFAAAGWAASRVALRLLTTEAAAASVGLTALLPLLPQQPGASGAAAAGGVGVG